MTALVMRVPEFDPGIDPRIYQIEIVILPE
jgi:hypothetical protein